MAGLNSKQIEDRINQMLVGDSRQLVFWYDDNGEFKDVVATLKLSNAKLYIMKKGEQFRTKHFLEIDDPVSNYLVYAPYAKPDIKDNHIEDMLLYSKRFYADLVSLMCTDLAIPDEYRSVIEKYKSFFTKNRVQAFANLGIETFNEDTILTGMVCVVCRVKTFSFDGAIKEILEDSLHDNKYLTDLIKYGLVNFFWSKCADRFGYIDEKPNISSFVKTLFVTYLANEITHLLPGEWGGFISHKSSGIIVFLKNLMDDVKYQDLFDKLSDMVEGQLGVMDILAGYDISNIIDTEIFCGIDDLIIKWVIEQLLSDNTNARIAGLSISDICNKRAMTHYGKLRSLDYQLLCSALYIINHSDYSVSGQFTDIISRYIESDCDIDSEYRRFYFTYDKIKDNEAYNGIRELVEGIYTNKYLERLLPVWNTTIGNLNNQTKFIRQRNFYSHYVERNKDRTVVIISDAMRYEVGKELAVRLMDDAKNDVSIEAMISVLPSFTKLGMPALLPNNFLSFDSKFNVIVNGKPSVSITDREKILQASCPNSSCYQFDNIKSLKKEELREKLRSKQVVYIYHNRIDALGDKYSTDDDVFKACDEAIDEIYNLIRNIGTGGNTQRFIITSDHGFIYKRDEIQEREKISLKSEAESIVSRRYIISSKAVDEVGVKSLPLNMILDKDEKRIISFPVSDSVFKEKNTGKKYVHGGSSPQEMIIPVIKVKVEKGRMETEDATLECISRFKVIKNSPVYMQFFQTKPVSDIVKAARYKLYFVADGVIVSDINTLEANIRSQDSNDRIKRIPFNFNTISSDSNKEYTLVEENADTGDKKRLGTFKMDIISS